MQAPLQGMSAQLTFRFEQNLVRTYRPSRSEGLGGDKFVSSIFLIYVTRRIANNITLLGKHINMSSKLRR